MEGYKDSESLTLDRLARKLSVFDEITWCSRYLGFVADSLLLCIGITCARGRESGPQTDAVRDANRDG